MSSMAASTSVWLVGPVGKYGTKGTPSCVFVPMMAGFSGRQRYVCSGEGTEMMAYDLGLIAGKGTLSVVCEHHLIVDDGGKSQSRTSATFLICGEEIFQCICRDTSHAWNSLLGTAHL